MKAGLFILLIYFPRKNDGRKRLVRARVVDNQLRWLRGLRRTDARLRGIERGNVGGGRSPVEEQVATLGVGLAEQSRVWGYHFDKPQLLPLSPLPSN